jgi:hypothetical protein
MTRTGRLVLQLRRCAGLGAAIALVAAGATACINVNHYDKPGRAKVHKVKAPKPDKHAHGAELVYDSGLGVYVVVGYPGHYHDGHRYYRKLDGRWWVSPDLHGRWVVISTKQIPPGLRGKHKKHHPASRRR